MTLRKKIYYVHPSTTMSRQCIIPFSVPALVKRLKYKVEGRFQDDLKDSEIREASIIFLDIHWYLSLYGAEKLVKRIKQVNKKCIVIAGGITASEYPKPLIDKFGIDFVVRGDGEIPFPRLINTIMEEENCFDDIPNIIGKNGINNPRSYILRSSDMEENDYLDIDFFPDLKKEIYKIQKNNISPWSEIIFPYMVPFRGCPIDCVGCAGAITEQIKLFGRKPVMRSAGKLRDDFDRCNANPNIHFVSIYHDFVTLLHPKYAYEVLSKPLRLNVRMEFNSKPEMDQLELILNTFKGGVINFSIDHYHLTSANIIDPEHMIKLINRVKDFPSFFTVLSYNAIFAHDNENYKKGMREIVRKTRCLISDEAFYWTEHPIPDKQGFSDEDMFQTHVQLSRDKKFIKSNLTNMYDMTEPYLPDTVSLAIRKTHQWMTQNVPYYFKSVFGEF
ncbi:MAG: cobalamin-dependent protein [Chitinophagales bacterium]